MENNTWNILDFNELFIIIVIFTDIWIFFCTHNFSFNLKSFCKKIHVKETLIQTSCLSNQSLWFNRNYEIENPSFRSLKIFIRQTDKWHCQINANCQLTSQRVVVAITVCAAWCAWTVNGAGPDVVSGCACIASFEFRRGKFKRSEEKFLNRHGTSKFLIVIWYFNKKRIVVRS